MYDVRQKVVTHPSSFAPDSADASTTPSLHYLLRLCRAAFLVALGIAIHMMVPAGTPFPIPMITPHGIVPMDVLRESSIVVERSMIFAARTAEVAPPKSTPVPPSHTLASNAGVSMLPDAELVPDLPVPAAISAAAESAASVPEASVPDASVPQQSAIEPLPVLQLGLAPEPPVTVLADAIVVKAPQLTEAPRALERPVPAPAILRRADNVEADVAPVPRSVGREARLSSNGAISEEELVQRLLEDFTGAYGRLDVSATKAVWPTVDGKALKRAFDQLSSQHLTLQACGITISGSTANARCRGSATYQPRIGTRSVQVASREWTFDLSKQDTAWRIVNTFVR
jgi:hypothetical protein